MVCAWLADWFFFFQAEDGIRDRNVTGVKTCALPIFEVGVRTLFEHPTIRGLGQQVEAARRRRAGADPGPVRRADRGQSLPRSEERRVGKEWRSGGRPGECKERETARREAWEEG